MEGRKALEVNDGRHKRDMGKWNDWKWHLVLDKCGYDNADGDDVKPLIIISVTCNDSMAVATNPNPA